MAEGKFFYRLIGMDYFQGKSSEQRAQQVISEYPNKYVLLIKYMVSLQSNVCIRFDQMHAVVCYECGVSCARELVGRGYFALLDLTALYFLFAMLSYYSMVQGKEQVESLATATCP